MLTALILFGLGSFFEYCKYADWYLFLITIFNAFLKYNYGAVISKTDSEGLPTLEKIDSFIE